MDSAWHGWSSARWACVERCREGADDARVGDQRAHAERRGWWHGSIRGMTKHCRAVGPTRPTVTRTQPRVPPDWARLALIVSSNCASLARRVRARLGTRSGVYARRLAALRMEDSRLQAYSQCARIGTKNDARVPTSTVPRATLESPRSPSARNTRGYAGIEHRQEGNTMDVDWWNGAPEKESAHVLAFTCLRQTDKERASGYFVTHLHARRA